MIERFFRPERLEDLSLALEELDRSSAGDMADVWDGAERGSRAHWSTLRLLEPTMHPASPRLWAAATGVSPAAIAALQRSDAFVAGDGELTLWPWYREEDGMIRPLAEAEKARTGLAIPRDFLDEPWDPSHYLELSGKDALRSFLASHGVDMNRGFVDRVPVPPRRQFKRVMYEGGLSAEPIIEQRFLQLYQAISTAEGLDPEETPEAFAAIPEVFGRVVAAMGGDPVGETEEPCQVEPPSPPEEIPAVGLAISVWALDGGALLATEGRIVILAEDGSLSWATVCPDRVDFATGHGVSAGGRLLDLSRRTWRSGDRSALAAELGLPDFFGALYSSRRAHVRSACGRYSLGGEDELDIERLSDRITVASGKALARSFGDSRGRGLLRAEDLEMGTSVTIDGVRFTLRNDRPSAMEAESPTAFALARPSVEDPGRWRVLSRGTVREDGRALARIGVAPVGAAFTSDGSRLWVLFPDHLARIDLDEPQARVAVLVPLAPILAAAEAP